MFLIKDKIVSQEEAVNKSWEKFNEHRTSTWGLAGHDTGHHYLNMMIGGFVPGKLTTIGARSGVGKTAMVTQFFQAGSRVLKQRRAEFLFFSWEMNPEYIIDRHVSNRTGLTLRQLSQTAKLIPDRTLELVKQAYDEAQKLPVHYQVISLNIKDVVDISNKFVNLCRQLSDVEGVEVLPVIVIDFIGMAQFDGYGARTYGIAEFMYGCKQLATNTNSAVVVFSQINRTADLKETPSRADFSDSQSIEQASDNLILLHRPEYHKVPTIRMPGSSIELPSDGKALIQVLKSRDFGTSDAIINCDIKFYRFWGEGMRWDDEYWKQYDKEQFWEEQVNLIF